MAMRYSICSPADFSCIQLKLMGSSGEGVTLEISLEDCDKLGPQLVDAAKLVREARKAMKNDRN